MNNVFVKFELEN